MVLESRVAVVGARRSSANEHVDRTEKVTKLSAKTWGVSRWSNQSSLKSRGSVKPGGVKRILSDQDSVEKTSLEHGTTAQSSNERASEMHDNIDHDVDE